MAGAFRVEAVLAGVEVGADTYLRRDQNPRFGFDVSTGIWDFDVYGDVAVRPGGDFAHYFPSVSAPSPDPNPTVPTLYGFTGYETQAVGGINYSRKYNDNDMWTLGVEYFYNHPGYTRPAPLGTRRRAASGTRSWPTRSPSRSSTSASTTAPST